MPTAKTHKKIHSKPRAKKKNNQEGYIDARWHATKTPK